MDECVRRKRPVSLYLLQHNFPRSLKDNMLRNAYSNMEHFNQHHSLEKLIVIRVAAK
jgi:hypothetical protein